jgi:hypothetical protein
MNWSPRWSSRARSERSRSSGKAQEKLSIVSAWARGLQIDCGCFSKGGELTGGRTAEYGLEILRDVGFLVLAGILLVKPRTKYSVDGLLMGAR